MGKYAGAGERRLEQPDLSPATYLSSRAGETVELPLDGTRLYDLLQERVRRSADKDSNRTGSFPEGQYDERWSIKW